MYDAKEGEKSLERKLRDVREIRYRSPAFHGGLAGLFGDRAAATIAAVLEAGVIPVGQEIPEDMALGHEATFVLALVASSLISPVHALEGARAALALDYQIEFGSAATDDRKGRRTGSSPPDKDYFGSQLAITFRNLAFPGSSGGNRIWPFEVSIGWTALGRAIATIHYPRRETTFVYASGHLFPDLHPGIVRMNSLEFDLPVNLKVSAEKISRFARLMRGDDTARGAGEGRRIDG